MDHSIGAGERNSCEAGIMATNKHMLCATGLDEVLWILV